MYAENLGTAAVLATGLLFGCQQAPPVREPATVARLSRGPEHDARMQWWREARFGMFVHWGLYAVPAGQWNGKPVSGTGEWIMHNAKIPVPDYEPLTKQFNPVKFDAKEWVKIAKDAGCKYLVITSKHHDGFAIYNSQVSDYDIADRTAFKRDPLAELAAACRDGGLKLCFYYSIWDWHHPLFKKGTMPEYTLYMQGQLRELLTNYGDIGVLWFDGEWTDEWTEEQGRSLEAFCRSIKPDVIINNRIGKARSGMEGHSAYQGAGDYDTPEQEIPARGLPNDWETCMTMNDTWGFRCDDSNWKTDTAMIHMLVDIASKGGNFLLNVGPTAAGEIPQPSARRMAAIGNWMEVNGEAIYGTDASPIGRLPWGRCTAKGNRLYLHVFDWPADGVLKIPGLQTPLRRATLLAQPGQPLTVQRSDVWTTITVPASAPTAPVSVIVAEFDNPPRAATYCLPHGKDGLIKLDAADATLIGRTIKPEHGPNYNLGFWHGDSDAAQWTVLSPAGGTYRVELELSAQPDTAGRTARLAIGSQSINLIVPATKGWSDYHVVHVGMASLAADTPTLVTLRPADSKPSPLMNLRSVRLVPVK